MDSYMASNRSCFMVTWTIFKNHLLEVDLTQKPGDHGTPNSHIRWLILFYHVWRPCKKRDSLNYHLGWGPGHILGLHTTLEGPWPHYMTLEVSCDGLWTLSFGLSHFHGHGSWLVCEMALMLHGNGLAKAAKMGFGRLPYWYSIWPLEYSYLLIDLHEVWTL